MSVLNCFSKVYKNILKTQLVEKMNNLLSPLESFNMQHVLTRPAEEWRKNLDNSYVIGAALTNLSKAFD